MRPGSVEAGKPSRYRFGRFDVDRLAATLTENGEERYLRPQTFRVLLYLIDHRDTVVSRDELFEHIWPDTAVTNDALVQCIVDIRRALQDDSRHSRFVRTVPKVGYRFIGEVEPETREALEPPAAPRETERRSGEPAAAGPTRPSPASPRGYSWMATLAALITLSVGGLWLAASPARPSSQPVPGGGPAAGSPVKVVAVLPFDQRPAAPELEWLGEGVADMMITALARSPRLRIVERHVVSRLLARRQPGVSGGVTASDASRIARRAGAHLFVRGTVTTMGRQLRIDAHIHDSTDGRLLSTEHLVVEDVNLVLTEVDVLSDRVARALGLPPGGQPDVASFTTGNLEAYRYYVLGLRKARGLHNRDAIELFEKAIALDPAFAMAHARIGYTYAISWNLPEQARPHLERASSLGERLSERDRLSIAAWYAIAQPDDDTAIETLRTIVSRYPDDVEAYVRLGRILHGRARLDEAIGILTEALRMDPESPEVHHALSNVYSDRGDHREAIEAGQQYVIRAPDEPNAYDALGLAHQWAGEYERAVAAYERALELKPDFELATVHLANAHYQLGHYRRALELYERYLYVAPSWLEVARAHRSMTMIWIRLGKLAKAEHHAAEEGRASDVLQGSWWLAVARGDAASAERLAHSISKAFILPNRGARPYLRVRDYYLGFAAFMRGDHAGAESLLKSALANRPPTWDLDVFEDCLGRFYLERRAFDAAIAEYARVLAINPRYPLARYWLGIAHAEAGRPDQARRELARFLEDWRDADPDIPEVVDARRRLAGTGTRDGRTSG